MNVDLKQNASTNFNSAVSIFLKDLEALPEEAYTKSFGEKVRTVADIVYEVNLVNDHVGMVLRGEEPFEWPDEGWIKAPAGFDSKEKVVAAFKESTDRIQSTIDSFSAEDMEATVQTENGERTRFQRCQFMALHVWYHLGQINFVQTLLGDDEWHWK